MGQVVGCALFAADVYAPPLLSMRDGVSLLLALLLVAGLLILVVNSWRACNLLAEIRDCLRRDWDGAPQRAPGEEALRQRNDTRVSPDVQAKRP